MARTVQENLRDLIGNTVLQVIEHQTISGVLAEQLENAKAKIEALERLIPSTPPVDNPPDASQGDNVRKFKPKT